MGNETKNYKFPKPSEDDFYDISEYNQAMDLLDETLTGMNDRKLDSDGNASAVVTEFNQEILRENIESGEKLSVSHGKIQKWFSEMKNIAFSGRASDATQDAAHRFVTDTEKDSWNAKVSASGGDISGTKIGSLETITTEFPVPAEGETPKVFLGKVKKFIRDFNDFKVGIITVGKLVNNGQTTAAGYALDARYGKTLYDLYTQLNSDITVRSATFDASTLVVGEYRLGYISIPSSKSFIPLNVIMSGSGYASTNVVFGDLSNTNIAVWIRVIALPATFPSYSGSVTVKYLLIDK